MLVISKFNSYLKHFELTLFNCHLEISKANILHHHERERVQKKNSLKISAAETLCCELRRFSIPFEILGSELKVNTVKESHFVISIESDAYGYRIKVNRIRHL